MWATSQGDRTLCGDEARLILTAVGYLHDMITAGVDLNEPYQTGVVMFDTLQPTQQMAILHEVAHGLLDPETPIVELTAVRESTVYAIYCELGSLVEIELEYSQQSKLNFELRERIIQAYLATDEQSNQWDDDLADTYASELDVPALDCEEIGQWNRVIEVLADRVLWDRDFELEEAFADHDPEKIKVIKRYMGINEDYFAAAAPDASSNHYMKLHRELIGLTQNIRKTNSLK